MVDELFLQSAVNIRRQYLKISNNMNLYHKRAKEIIQILEGSVKELEDLQNRIKNKKDITAEKSINEIMEIIQNVESEGERLEKLVDPMNKEIEKLSKEENELYRQIKEKHTNLSDEQILTSVQSRLEKEGL